MNAIDALFIVLINPRRWGNEYGAEVADNRAAAPLAARAGQIAVMRTTSRWGRG
jgi:hypothetical protein